MTAKDHYDNHLGNFYSWMYGDFAAKRQEQEQFFRNNEITPQLSTRAIDLGAGHGVQTVALLRLGFQVTAVDFNDQLLHELIVNAEGRATIVNADLNSFLTHYRERAAVITCMGDTLTHLKSIAEVTSLLEESNRVLFDHGKLILSFRDLTSELSDVNRFIPVKSDDSRIATCFLEYFTEYVMVYDIVHERIDGEWRQKISYYPKLRLNLQIMRGLLASTKFEIVHTETINRMIYLIARKLPTV